jgi:hypothetical protein
MFDCLPDFDRGDKDSLTNKFLPLCSKIAIIIKDGGTRSINDIVQFLLEDGNISVGYEHQHIDSALSLVFTVIGWLTLLYRPDALSCPPAEFCIADEMDGHRGEGHMSLKQDRMGSSKRLPDFLLGFGVMIPPANYHAFEDAEEIKLFDKLKSVEPSTLNLSLLTTIGGVSVEWTDCLACHLELDRDARLIYLFRYPSFCQANLRDAGAKAGIIYACASDDPNNHHWGTREDVSRLLEEILLSYRLLCGQDVKSRRLFQKLSPYQDTPSSLRDDLLAPLCTSKGPITSLALKQRGSYDLARDFPHLRARIVRLHSYLNQRKPRSWSELWVDNRDSASWLTFWAVIIIGGVGLLLAFIQVVLQVIQVAYQLQHPDS